MVRRLVVATIISLALWPSSAGAQDSAAPSATAHPATFAAWTSVVSQLLLRNSKSPPHSPKASGHVVITFTVARDGHVLTSKVIEPSGFAAYDKAALQILSRTQPFPPIPASDTREQATFNQSFRFVYDPPVRHRARKTHG